jgi:hypothetical protein
MGPSNGSSPASRQEAGRGDRRSFEPSVREFPGALLEAAEERAPLLAAVAPRLPASVHHVNQKFRPPYLTLPETVLYSL